jgi:hypothetical protein
LNDTILQLEKMRKTVVLYIIFSFLTVILAFTLTGFFYPLGMIIFIQMVSMIVSANKKRKIYVSEFKKIIGDYFQESFDNVAYIPKRGLSYDVIKKTDMIRKGNLFSSDDYVSGSYKNVNFKRSDVCIQNTQSIGKIRKLITYFQGKWLIFDFNKRFNNDLQVVERSFAYARKSGSFFNSKPHMNKFELECVEFNKIFSVSAANNQDAFYILTPHLMESIRRVNQYVKGKLLLCFIDNYLHVAINTGKNAMEPPTFSKINDRVFNDIYNEIRIIMCVVDELRLDNNLFLMNEF